MSYVILVGRERPEEAIVSHPKKDGTPSNENPLKRYVAVGKHMMVNPTSVWGRRVIDGKATVGESKSKVELYTPGYTGEVEFLEYGHKDGYIITIRYLKQSRSLDMEYQDNIQKLKVDLVKGEDGSGLMILDAGENKFDEKKDALLVQYFRVHGQNRDSVSKNPNPAVLGFTFYEVTDDNVKTASIEKMETSFDAGYIVKTASKSEADLKVLLEIVGEREELIGIDNLSKSKQIYEGLLKFAMSNPSDFMSLIDNWKKKFSDAVSKARSYKALDLTKDGHIALLIEEKPNLMFSDIKAKGDKMIDWVMENYTNADVFKKAQGFITLTEKLK
jgi:hypothetical protein